MTIKTLTLIGDHLRVRCSCDRCSETIYLSHPLGITKPKGPLKELESAEFAIREHGWFVKFGVELCQECASEAGDSLTDDIPEDCLLGFLEQPFSLERRFAALVVRVNELAGRLATLDEDIGRIESRDDCDYSEDTAEDSEDDNNYL